MTPTLIIITAMAAKNSEAIFAKAFEPPSPITLSISLAFSKTNNTIIKFSTIDRIVSMYPKLSSKIRIVVNAAGPIIRGTPKGTMPMSVPGFLTFSEDAIISLIESISKYYSAGNSKIIDCYSKKT